MITAALAITMAAIMSAPPDTEPAYATPIGQAVTECQTRWDLIPEGPNADDPNAAWSDWLVMDEGHSVLANGQPYANPDDPHAPFVPFAFKCLAEELDLPEWVQTRVAFSNSGERSGQIDVGDYTVVWQLRDRPLGSGFLVYDREVGGGQR